MAKSRDLISVQRAFAAIPKAARKVIDKALQQGADEMVARMKYLAPVDDEDGGELLDSIRKEPGPDPLSITVTAGGPTTTRQTERGPYDYSLAAEYGRQGEGGEAQPFFWPSVNTTKKRVRRRVDRAISKAVKEAWSE
ncbi:HK97 gp10 family phage protein [Mesorhizobium sp. CN2-181]|uniref:HK97 gp10 family phage protein n=1 Tax=Mesorhizobium yinganensis TaxID=3157707 RepID=UPI0032B6FC9E